MKMKIHLIFYLLVLWSFSCNPHNEINNVVQGDWRYYQGDLGRNQYSTLDQINKENVSSLEVAWVYKTGDHNPDGYTQIQCNPLIIDGILYGTSPGLKCFAIDASSGNEIWSFSPDMGEGFNFSMGVNRGLTYWGEGDEKRLFYIASNFLICLDPKTGKLEESFGEGGIVDIKKGLGPESEKHYVTGTSPGAVYQDKIIIGCRVSEDRIAAPGYIRAYNVRSGKQEWIFHTIPKPDEYGYWTWPEDAYERIGGANNWAGMSVDPEYDSMRQEP